MKATEDRVFLCGTVYPPRSLDETLACDHANESYGAVHSYGTGSYVVQNHFTFKDGGWNPSVWPFKWKLAIEQYVHVALFTVL